MTPSSPLGVENVKIREYSEKIRGPQGDPLQPFLGPEIFFGALLASKRG